MGMYVDSVVVLQNDGFGITRENLEKALRWAEKHEDELPESHPFDNIRTCNDDGELTEDFLYVNHFWWTGSGSYSSLFEKHFKKACSFFSGRIDLVFNVYEGEIQIGCRIENGKFTEHDVEMKLGAKIK